MINLNNHLIYWIRNSFLPNPKIHILMLKNNMFNYYKDQNVYNLYI